MAPASLASTVLVSAGIDGTGAYPVAIDGTGIAGIDGTGAMQVSMALVSMALMVLAC